MTADSPSPQVPPSSAFGAMPRALVLEALPGLGLALSGAQIDALLAYLDLISKWTRVYNLTAVRDPAEMVTHHLLDCLAAMPALARLLTQGGLAADLGQGLRLLDVGSGAGLPGVVIAVCFPSVNVTCVDTVAKKTAFIKQVALTLKLPNLAGLHARVEAIGQQAGVPPGASDSSAFNAFDVIASRAFASLAHFAQWSEGALAPAGVWMAMKGKNPQDELAALPPTVEVFHVEQLKVPSLDAERCIVWMRKRAGQAG